jgi:hypothetical protein
MELNIDHYVALVDTLILLLLLGWSWMDRNNIYLREKPHENPGELVPTCENCRQCMETGSGARHDACDASGLRCNCKSNDHWWGLR